MGSGDGKPEWAWFPPDADWWTPACVWWDFNTDRITPAHVLPRLVGCGHDVEFDDVWVDRFDRPELALVDDDPGIKRVPGPMSRRWLELLADRVDGDRAETLRELADPAADTGRRENDSLRLRELRLFVTLATMDDAWTAGGWLARGVFWFLNAGLVTSSTMLDLIELESAQRDAMLPGSTPIGVIGEFEAETEETLVIAVYEPAADRGRSRVEAHRCLQAWLAGDTLGPVEERPCFGYVNKTHGHGRFRGIVSWNHVEGN